MIKYTPGKLLTITMIGTPEEFIKTMNNYLDDEKILNNEDRRRAFFEDIIKFAKDPTYFEDLYV